MKYQIIAKGAIYYVTMEAVIFSREDIMFSHETSPGISLVIIIINRGY